jgi:hypothetical protein
MLGPPEDDGFSHGAVLWRVSGGTAAFTGASAAISSNFLVNLDTEELLGSSSMCSSCHPEMGARLLADATVTNGLDRARLRPLSRPPGRALGALEPNAARSVTLGAPRLLGSRARAWGCTWLADTSVPGHVPHSRPHKGAHADPHKVAECLVQGGYLRRRAHAAVSTPGMHDDELRQ